MAPILKTPTYTVHSGSPDFIDSKVYTIESTIVN